MIISLIGTVAFFTSTVSLLPQIYLTYKTKSAKDISYLMLINFFICSLSWTFYGFLTNATTVWLTNIFMTVTSILILFLKIKYSTKKTIKKTAL
jgi:MtN3 and saliva related transmembrane protein